MTITVFRLLGFAKLSRKNRAAKNLRRSGEIAKSQIQRRSALFIAQNCAAKDSRRSGAIAKPTLNMGQQQLPRKKQRCKEFSAVAAQSRSLKSNTSQPQLPRKKPRCKEFAAQRRNREVPNSMKVSIIYCPKLRCKEFAAQRRNREANIKHRTATITAKKPRCKEFSAQRRNREA